MSVLICIVLVILAVLFVQSVKNRAIALEESVKTALSDVNVQEKRRVDLLYNLVDCVKHYDAHEAEVLSGLAEKMRHGNETADREWQTAVHAVAFHYPELQSSRLYQDLMRELSMTENLIARHRENYNAAVNAYHRYLRQFPENVLLPALGYQEQSYERLHFEAPTDAPQNLFEDRR